MMLFSEAGAPFRLGMRAAAKWLDAKYGIKSIDRAVFTAHGEAGCMVPNQYSQNLALPHRYTHK